MQNVDCMQVVKHIMLNVSYCVCILSDMEKLYQLKRSLTRIHHSAKVDTQRIHCFDEISPQHDVVFDCYAK